MTHVSRNQSGDTRHEEFVASSEAAVILGRTPDSVRLMARTGRLRTAIRTRAGRLYRRADVERLALKLRGA